MKANWGHLRNIFTMTTAGPLAVQSQVGFPHCKLQFWILCAPGSRRSGLPAGLWPQVPAPGSERVTLPCQETAWEGQARCPRRFSLGLESKLRVDGADPPAGSPSPLPIFNSPNLDRDLPGPFVTWPRGRQVRSALGGDDRALETLWEADASLGQSHKGSRPARW